MMKYLQNPRFFRLCTLALVLLSAAVWYVRPVDIHVLSGNADIENLHITILRTETTAPHHTASRTLNFNRNDDGFAGHLAQLESLHFRRDLTGPLIRLLPFLECLHDGPKTIPSDRAYYDHLTISLYDARQESPVLFLTFCLDEWELRDLSSNVSLLLHCTEPEGSILALADTWYEESLT